MLRSNQNGFWGPRDSFDICYSTVRSKKLKVPLLPYALNQCAVQLLMGNCGTAAGNPATRATRAAGQAADHCPPTLGHHSAAPGSTVQCSAVQCSDRHPLGQFRKFRNSGNSGNADHIFLEDGGGGGGGGQWFSRG
jgi:hypothetical protein